MTTLHLFPTFFFQAEDGIRDGHVTGVQTCALPICAAMAAAPACTSSTRPPAPRPSPRCEPPADPGPARSEERRVGKERRRARSTAANERRKFSKRGWSDSKIACTKVAGQEQSRRGE